MGTIGTVTSDFVWCECGWIRERAAEESKTESWRRWELHLDHSHPRPAAPQNGSWRWAGLVTAFAALLVSCVVLAVVLSQGPSSTSVAPTPSPAPSAPPVPGSFSVQCPTGTTLIVLATRAGESRCYDAQGRFLGFH